MHVHITCDIRFITKEQQIMDCLPCVQAKFVHRSMEDNTNTGGASQNLFNKLIFFNSGIYVVIMIQSVNFSIIIMTILKSTPYMYVSHCTKSQLLHKRCNVYAM